jgi:hypothetical protein
MTKPKDKKVFNLELPDNLSKDQLNDLLSEVKAKIKEKSLSSTDIHITCILDISGSMSSIRDDSIGGFNTFIQEQKESKDGDAFLTVHLFDDKFETLYENVPIANVKPLTRDDFVPRGSTALTDALGKTLMQLLKTDNKNNIIVILTDGGENSSKTFTTHDVKKLTMRCEEKNWQFVYLGANQDSFGVTQHYGMLGAHTANYVADSAGTRTAYASASNYTKMTRSKMAATDTSAGMSDKTAKAS